MKLAGWILWECVQVTFHILFILKILHYIFIFILSKRLTGKSVLFCLFLLYLGWKMTTQYADYMSFCFSNFVCIYIQKIHIQILRRRH